MKNIILFIVLSLPVLAISWRTLFKPRSHGFYRFFSWECIVWLFVVNHPFWFDHPFSFRQILSWILLIISGYLVFAGVIRLKKTGKPRKSRDGESLYTFEKTTQLVEKGIFKYIRHPLYASLLFLTWGIFLKNPAMTLLIVSLFSTIFLDLTARAEEKECIEYFGDAYRDYMKRSKRFIPFVL